METSFTVELDQRHRPYRLIVEGELDICTGSELQSAVRRAVEGGDMRPHLGLDCYAVTFIDGAGIGSVLAARKYAASRGLPLGIVRPSRQTRRLLEMLDLCHLISPAQTAA